MGVRFSEYLYKDIVENNSDAIFIVHPETGQILQANQAACFSVGRGLSELLKEGLKLVSKNCENEEFLFQFLQKVKTEKSVLHEGIHKHRDGSVFPVELTVRFVESPGDSYIVAFAKNIAERKRAESLERQLLQAQKMDALGTLASGVAHDFNNTLQGLNHVLDILKAKSNDKSLVKYIESGSKMVDKGQDLVREITRFARGTQFETKVLRFEDVLKEARSLLQVTVPQSVQLIVDNQSILPFEGNVTQLIHALINLCNNSVFALESIKGSKEIRISIKDLANSAQCFVGLPQNHNRQFIEIVFSDNGSGIEVGCQTRIFDPFFSTKALHEGTGLGLSQVYQVVVNHRGHIFLDTSFKEGTRFKLYLPAIESENEVSGESPTVEQRGKTVKDKKNFIVLVDDEVELVLLQKEIFESVGFDVAEFSDPFEALSYLKNPSSPVDLLVCDNSMPILNGYELVQEIGEFNKDLPVVMISGFTDTKYKECPQIKSFIQKPFSTDKILSEINNVLRSAP